MVILFLIKCERFDRVRNGYQWGRRLEGSYLEGGHGRVPVIPVYGVELGGVVEFMVEL